MVDADRVTAGVRRSARSVPVTAVILTHNRPAQLESCLQGVMAQDPRPSHVIVVDNASTVPTSRRLGSFGDITLIRLEQNRGSAGGFHAGLAAAAATDGDWWWIMDDDCVPGARSLDHLYCACAAAPHSVAGAAPSVRFTDGYVRFGMSYTQGDVTPSSSRNSGIDWAPFLGLLLRAEACRAVGAVRDDYFMWHEDAEYCRRLQRGGWSLISVPAAEMFHPSPPSAPKTRDGKSFYPAGPTWRQYYAVRNSFLVDRTGKRGSSDGRYAIMFRALRELKYLVIIAWTCPRKHGGDVWMRFRGLLDGLRGRSGPRVAPGYEPRLPLRCRRNQDEWRV